MVNGIKNVFETFKAIGRNIIQGNFLRSIPVAEKYEDTVLGKVAEFITKPAAIIGAPAAVAAAKIAAPAIALKAGAGIKATAAAGSKFIGSAAFTKGALVAGSLYAGKQILRGTTRTFEKAGAEGLIKGSGTVEDVAPQDVVTYEGTAPSGEPIKITVTGEKVAGATYGIDQYGNVVPYLFTGSGKTFESEQDKGILSSLIPTETKDIVIPLLFGLGAYFIFKE